MIVFHSVLIYGIFINICRAFAPQSQQNNIHPTFTYSSSLSKRMFLINEQNKRKKFLKDAGRGGIISLFGFLDDHFFAVNGFITGLFLTTATAASRIVSANDAWEERLTEYQENDDGDDDEKDIMTELDRRAEIANMSPSKYGPQSIRERIKRRQQRRFMDEDNEDDDATIFEEEAKAFKENFGIQFDPFYDQPYTEEELPADVDFSKDPFFGDRVYENGEIFFKDGNLFYRKGSRPRMKFFWE